MLIDIRNSLNLLPRRPSVVVYDEQRNEYWILVLKFKIDGQNILQVKRFCILLKYKEKPLAYRLLCATV